MTEIIERYGSYQHKVNLECQEAVVGVAVQCLTIRVPKILKCPRSTLEVRT